MGATGIAVKAISRLCLFALTLLLAACSGGGGGGSTAYPVTMTLTASVISPSEVALSWTPHTSAVIGYDVNRNGGAAFPTHIQGTALTDHNLTAATQYCYVVYAVDFLLGIVGQSNSVCVTTQATAGWNTVTVGNGSFVSLALDAGNAHHVSYRNANGVQIATDAAGAWSVENINTGAGAFGHTAIAISGTGAVHTSYFDAQAGLRYATNNTGVWVSATVDNMGGQGSALALDGTGKAYISYANNSLDTVKYATNASGSWVTTFILPGYSNVSVLQTSLALDSNGATHIGYAVGSSQFCAIRYAENVSGSWTNNTLIDNDAQCGTALAIDANKVAHIAYMKSSTLHYATNGSGSWVSTIVDTLSWIGGAEVSIAIDSSGRVHISYQDALNQNLKYSTNASGTWQGKYIASNGGGYSQIRVDPTGKIHIAYTEETTGAVKLATSP